MIQPDDFARQAARPRSPPELVMAVVMLRRKRMSMRQIAEQHGLSMDGVRQILLRYSKAQSSAAADAEADAECDDGLMTSVRETMPAGHPVSMNAIWTGLERWRNFGDVVQRR
ncbi:hypothetical protein [Acetobacter persici]|uniref:hypothetical protein n=1 Tax=Acetobacter persici TaxID=1076596 RepID=UPI001BA8CBEC|nr:hypothetical protein [Acetobacter persici]MBS1014475.1 hypothetical protein [Acetobacter persici]